MTARLRATEITFGRDTKGCPRGRPGRRFVGRCTATLLALGLLTACGSPDASGDEGLSATPAPQEPGGSTEPSESPGVDEMASDTIPGTVWTERDWQILVEKVEWADAQGLDAMPWGEAMAALGRTFVGTTYIPGTLEAPGDEHIVVNLRELDCVTFIENVWALLRFHRSEGVAALADPEAARAAYEGHLQAIRYRDGRLSGYPSRLHYFSDWLWNHEDRGHLRLVTSDIGGVADSEAIDFMSTHPDAYRQLADPAHLDAIRTREAELTARGPRVFIPQEAVAAAAEGIRDGDIIAATSTVAGLDIAHTGIALWEDGRLHLLHAPLVGRSVEISELPLADRIQGIGGQDGIMVGRLQEDG